MNTKEVPVLLLTGYLGSGKTTLVNQILANKRGIKFAVIVNDIGEVNIDADLIQKGGVVGKKDDSLVALQNGCICCTLKMDLVEQIGDILKMQRFDYIVIEASGICEPEPIAQTICSIPTMGGMYTRYGICRLDSIVTVVDALRMQSEFACGDNLTRKHIDEEDIENLIIQQIEFCNIILLNKASEVKPEELGRIKQIIKTLQPAAEIIECDYGRIDLDRILNTRMFNFERVATSAGWIREIERQATPEEEREAHSYGHHDHEEHEHHHDEEHEHHHDEHEHHHDEADEHGHHHHHHHDHDEHDEHEHHHDHDEHDEHEHHHDHDEHDEHDEHEHHHHYDEHGVCSCGHHHHHHGHDADEVFVSWGRETVRKFGEDELSAMLAKLDGGEYGIVLRAKGIVPCTDGGWIHFDYTPGEQNIRKGPADYTGRLCVIGSKLVDEKLASLFGVA